MAKTNFHNKGFDEATKSKLEIFKEYFKESFPVFIHSNYFDEIIIYDFFAGQGQSIEGEFGTALNLLNEITSYCNEIRNSKKQVYLILNDKKEFEKLSQNINNYLKNCRENCTDKCVLEEEKNLIIRSNDFEEYFYEIYPKLLKRKKSAKLIFLDPYNFVIDKNLFSKLINLPSADFICFMPSSFLLRFPEEPAFKKYIDSKEVDFETSRPALCHRLIANYFVSLIPPSNEYYIGSFSIKKGSSYYGLLFGSNHSFGAEKFQRVCWKKDDVTGEASYNIDRELVYDRNQTILFKEEGIPLKLKTFRSELINAILSKKIKTDIDAYKFALKKRCLIKHSTEILKQLMKENIIKGFKTRKNDIHKIKEPNTIFVL